VRPGRYFVRGRATDALLEGTVDVAGGATLEVGDDGLHRTEYARLVRKGGSDVRVTHGPEAGYLLQTPMKDAASLCQGAYAGYVVHWRTLDVGARVLGCHASFGNDTLTASEDQLGGELRASHAWDLPLVTMDLGLGLGGSWLHQGFTTSGQAPARDTPAGHFGVGLGITVPVHWGTSIRLETSGVAYVFAQRQTGAGTSLGPWFSLRELAGLSQEW
jgi:hypothetical protein